jgi:hypothetical protein
MTSRRAALVFVLLSLLAVAAVDAEADRWWAHVRFLADDALEGRDTGNAGYRKAAAYVASEFEKAGLKPGGTAGYLQRVKFRSRRIGFRKDSPEHQIMKQWRAERYHAPSDDLRQPVDFKAAADFNRLYLAIVESVANRETRPRWNDDSFFRRFAQ